MSVTTESVLQALGQVEAPGARVAGDERVDIVSLGYVKDLAVAPERVSFRVEFPGPLTPARRAVADACRAALGRLAGEAGVEVALASRIPSTFVDDGKGLAPGVKNFVAVGSGKGGVGKSTVAVNLAAGLARAGARVGLLDTDVYGPSVPLLLGVTRQAFLEEMQLRQVRGEGQRPGAPPILAVEAHGVKAMSIGFLVDEGKAAIWRGPMVHGAVQQLLRDVDWGELDYLVLDLPPGTGDVQLTLSQSIPLAGGVIVATPQPVALADARKAVDLFRTTKTDVLGMVENMGVHVCSHCGHQEAVFGSGGAADAAKEWGIPFLGALPLDARVRQSGDRGLPLLADEDASGPLVDALWAVVDRLTHVLAGKARARPRSLPIRRS